MCQANQVDPTAGRLASPGKRLGAFVIDSIICFVAVIGVIVLAFVAVGGQEITQAIEASSESTNAAIESIEGNVIQGIVVAGIGVILFLLFNLYFYGLGTTPGHMMLGMRIIKQDGTTAGMGTMILREWIGKAISHLVMSLGFIWILIDGNRQGWHDKLVSTYVVEG